MPVEMIARPLQKSSLVRGHSSTSLASPQDYGDYARQEYVLGEDEPGLDSFMQGLAAEHALGDNSKEEAATCLSLLFMILLLLCLLLFSAGCSCLHCWCCCCCLDGHG